MRKAYKLEVIVIQDDERFPADSNAAGAIGAALTHLIEQLGVEVKSMRCCSADVVPDSQNEAAADPGDVSQKGGEYESGEYLAIWPNGDSSIVIAQCKRDAIAQLQHRAGPTPESVELFESFLDL